MGVKRGALLGRKTTFCSSPNFHRRTFSVTFDIFLGLCLASLRDFSKLLKIDYLSLWNTMWYFEINTFLSLVFYFYAPLWHSEMFLSYFWVRYLPPVAFTFKLFAPCGIHTFFQPQLYFDAPCGILRLLSVT